MTKRKIDSIGFEILKSSNLSIFNTFAKKTLNFIENELADESLNECLVKLQQDELNQLLIKADSFIQGLSDELISSFLTKIEQIVGKRFFYQKRPHLRIFVPRLKNTFTPFHADFMYGHSPLCYTLWIPLHDITEDNGIFLYNLKQSNEILQTFDYNSCFQRHLEEFKINPKTNKMKFGHAVLFKSSIVHGMVKSRSEKPRISIDFRFQKISDPFFEKNAEMYGVKL
jgi:sporadic carbohydrate cluster 2OG-Fe(II) oxygenase